jgi:hypothetical protein
MLAQNVSRIICTGHVHHDDILRCNCFPYLVKGECIVQLVKLGMWLGLILENSFVVTEYVANIADRTQR